MMDASMMYRFLRCALLLLTIPLSCAPALAADLGVDLSGHPVSDLGGPGVRFVVLIFAASDCPISNRYVPEIARLNGEFTSHGVRFWWVFPNAEDTAAKVSQHEREFAIKEDIVLDPKQTLVHLAHATITPEAAVFAVRDSELNEIYRGRIDDRYRAIGEERPQPSHHDLEAALNAALADKPIPRPAGPPVGCSVVFLQQ
jgi:hypothetical protein